MLAAIFGVFVSRLSWRFFARLISGDGRHAGATFLGGAVVSNLLKFVPGVGTVAGGVIATGTAGGLTTALGEAYIAVLAKLFTASEGDAPEPEAIAREFKDRMARRGRA